MSDFIDDVESQIPFRKKTDKNTNLVFFTKGSSGRNPEKLAKLLSTFDMVINILGWQDKPLAKLSDIVTQYQASIDAKYHNDFKDVLISEEIERKRADRKGVSILQQG